VHETNGERAPKQKRKVSRKDLTIRSKKIFSFKSGFLKVKNARKLKKNPITQIDGVTIM